MTRPMSLRAFAETVCELEPSPLIAAVMDASEGITPTTIDDAASAAHFGCPLADLPTERRRTVAVRAGGRGGKTSRLLAPKALHAAWTVPLPTLRRGEVASSLLVAPDLKLARQALSFVVGYVEESRILSRALVEQPTKESVELRRPDGKRVRIEVIAASRGGRGVRGRTLAFAGLDEAAFFYDEATGVVNDADIHRAVLQRVVPEGQVWIVSTPWLADTGLLETAIAKNFGTHMHALVCTAGTRALNPTWDPDGTIESTCARRTPTRRCARSTASRWLAARVRSSTASPFRRAPTKGSCFPHRRARTWTWRSVWTSASWPTRARSSASRRRSPTR